MSLLVIVSQSPANQGCFFFLFFFEKLHNLPRWERRDCTFCEYARVVILFYFWGNANLAKEIWQPLSRVALKIDDK
jgi:hypothetical protein